MQTTGPDGHAISRRHLIAGALTGASALLSACASAPPVATSATSSAAATTRGPAASTAGGTTVSAQPAQKALPSGQATTIRLMAWGDPQEQKARQVTLAAFQQQNPTIKVNFLLTPTNDYLNKLNTMLASGDVPDVIFIGNGDMWRYAKLGSLLPLTPLIARDHFDTSDINQQVYRLYNVDGDQYGFPVDAPSQQLYHNVTAFQEAGQPLPSYDWKDTSWNWETFVTSAQKLVKRDASGHVTRYAFPVQTGFRAWWIWVRANGGTMFNYAGTQCLLNQPPTVEAFQFLSDLIHKYKVAPTVAENQAVSKNLDDVWNGSKSTQVALDSAVRDANAVMAAK